MEGAGSKNRLFQIRGWEEKAKARHRRDGEKDEFSRKVESLDLGAAAGALVQERAGVEAQAWTGNRKACGRPWEGSQEIHNKRRDLL